MKLRYTYPLIVLLAACASQEPAPKTGGYPSELSRAQYVEQMADFANPGAEHAELAELEGLWDVSVSARQTGTDDWVKGSGTSEMKVVLEGRYLVEELNLSVGGERSQAFIIHGYNRLRQEHFAIWMNESTTWPTYTYGEEDGAGNVVRRGRFYDVATPGGRPFYVTLKREGDRIATTVFDTIDGADVEVMQVYRTPRAE